MAISGVDSGCKGITRTIQYVEFTGLCSGVFQIGTKCWMFWLKTRLRGCPRTCSGGLFVKSSRAGDGSYLSVLLWWGICDNRCKCVHWVCQGRWLPSYGIWWGWLVEEWCDVIWAMASCLPAYRGHIVMHCRGQLADWPHWCGFSDSMACWISSSVDGLQSDILKLCWALSILTPYRTRDTVESVNFLSMMLKRVHLISVCLWFCISDWDWQDPSVGLLVSGTKLCSLYNNKHWTTNMFYWDVGTLETFILLTIYLPIN